MSPQTVPSHGTAHVAVEVPFQHRCPFVHEQDLGTIRIAWTTQGNTIELHSLRAYLGTWADQEISHEEITQAIHLTLGDLEGIYVTDVTTTWDTAGMEVEVNSGGEND